LLVVLLIAFVGLPEALAAGPRLAIQRRLDDRTLVLRLVGAEPGTGYRIEYSTNLVAWKPCGEDLYQVGPGTFDINTQPYFGYEPVTGVYLPVCPDERFSQQRVAAFCTGFLVGPDLIATAGHCLDSTDLSQARFVFRFQMADAAHAITHMSADRVYRGVETVAQANEGIAHPDFCIVRLEQAGKTKPLATYIELYPPNPVQVVEGGVVTLPFRILDAKRRPVKNQPITLSIGGKLLAVQYTSKAGTGQFQWTVPQGTVPKWQSLKSVSYRVGYDGKLFKYKKTYKYGKFTVQNDGV
jgi:hypothetical protein